MKSRCCDDPKRLYEKYREKDEEKNIKEEQHYDQLDFTHTLYQRSQRSPQKSPPDQQRPVS